MPLRRPLLTLAASLLVLALLPACSGRQKNKRIPNVRESEEVIELLERYRHAVEARDVAAILSLTSVDYADTRGTRRSDDDLDRNGLEKKLNIEVEKISALKLNLELLMLTFDKPRTIATIELRYDLRFQLEMSGGSTWHNEVNVHQMLLRKEESGWRVISGL